MRAPGERLRRGLGDGVRGAAHQVAAGVGLEPGPFGVPDLLGCGDRLHGRNVSPRGAR
ncbi:MAG: hypothetical protein QM708_03250 [Propioniciclava sp.]|uniref:hypothetical protein n=1 Tax=Propioniciclava sp. TaxID=2038686 RepID=UPI0039E282EA